MKKLEIKRIFAYVIFKKLKDIPPKIYPSTDEIKATTEYILPALRKHVTEYAGFTEKLDDVRRKERKKKLNKEQVDKETERLQKKWAEYNDAHGEDSVVIELEDEGFKILLEQFEREDKQMGGMNDVWGRSWAANIDEFMELQNAFEKAEGDTKESKKKK